MVGAIVTAVGVPVSMGQQLESNARKTPNEINTFAANCFCKAGMDSSFLHTIQEIL
jgi:hypothetical protein